MDAQCVDIFMYKTEEDVAVSTKPNFDKSYGDDTYIPKKSLK